MKGVLEMVEEADKERGGGDMERDGDKPNEDDNIGKEEEE
jgi:hypothetical protein